MTRYIWYVRIINPQRMRSRHSYNNNIIIDAAWYRCLSRSLVSFGRMKPLTVASFQLVGYIILLAIDPTRQLAHHWSEHSSSADLAGMIVIVPKESGSWLDVGTAMSVE